MAATGAALEETPMPPMLRRACGMLALLLLAGCGRVDVAPPPARAPQPAAELPLLVLQELMDLLVDPAAGVVFAAADPQADPERRPASPMAWQAVADAADQLAEQGRQLAQPALSLQRADWLRLASALRERAVESADAARRQDAQRLARAGEQLRATCQDCHQRYGVTPLQARANP